MHMMKMHIIFIAFLGCLCLAVAEKPKFCRRFKCPLFETTLQADGYEIRDYGETNWLTTSVKSSSPWPSKQQKRSMFFKLFPYFQGRNSNGDRVKMAIPAVFKITPDGDDYEISMMFYVADSNPPTPRVTGTSIVTRTGEVYVKSFDQVKWPKAEEFDSVVSDLKNSLSADASGSFSPEVYYRASYDYPFSFKVKHHEVWFDKEV